MVICSVMLTVLHRYYIWNLFAWSCPFHWHRFCG